LTTRIAEWLLERLGTLSKTQAFLEQGETKDLKKKTHLLAAMITQSQSGTSLLFICSFHRAVE
jgi:hypothetical protein